jgi:hypothetical protein
MGSRFDWAALATERISWDGIRALSISRGSVTGEAYDLIKNTWMPFQVDLASGRISGGSYPEYSILPNHQDCAHLLDPTRTR